jgi:predicted metalloprotease with PDZ domain
MRRLFLFVSFLVSSAAFSPAQTGCFTCTDGVCNTVCCARCSCEYGCAVSPRCCTCCGGIAAAYVDEMHPGFLAEKDSDALVVHTIVLRSSAERAGLKVGDRIVKINGQQPRAVCSRSRWGANGSTLTEIMVRRNDRDLRLTMRLERVGELVRRGWVDGTGLLPVGLKRSRLPLPPVRGPFTLGIASEINTEGVLVRAVLRGSAAAASGIKAGDQIVAIDGKRDAAAIQRTVESLRDSLEKHRVSLTVSRDGQSLTISVELTGLSDVLPAFAPGGNTVPAARSVSLGGK